MCLNTKNNFFTPQLVKGWFAETMFNLASPLLDVSCTSVSQQTLSISLGSKSVAYRAYAFTTDILIILTF